MSLVWLLGQLFLRTVWSGMWMMAWFCLMYLKIYCLWYNMCAHCSYYCCGSIEVSSTRFSEGTLQGSPTSGRGNALSGYWSLPAKPLWCVDSYINWVEDDGTWTSPYEDQRILAWASAWAPASHLSQSTLLSSSNCSPIMAAWGVWLSLLLFLLTNLLKSYFCWQFIY